MNDITYTPEALANALEAGAATRSVGPPPGLPIGAVTPVNLPAAILAAELRKTQARVAALEAAIRDHRDQRADDRCWMDDDILYAALGDKKESDNRVGDKFAMIQNCVRYVDRRCAGGTWVSYAELEQTLADTVRELGRLLLAVTFRPDVVGDRNAAGGSPAFADARAARDRARAVLNRGKANGQETNVAGGPGPVDGTAG